MRIPKETIDIYKSFLIQNKALLYEHLDWAFPNTYKVHVCESYIKQRHSPALVVTVGFVEEVQDSIITTYILDENEIRKSWA